MLYTRGFLQCSQSFIVTLTVFWIFDICPLNFLFNQLAFDQLLFTPYMCVDATSSMEVRTWYTATAKLLHSRTGHRENMAHALYMLDT
jgi:hypothetical protein